MSQIQKKKKSQPQVKPSPIERTEPWGDFTFDAPVKVTAPRLEGKRGYRWVFRSYVRNSETLSEWVEVYGGTKGYEGLHAFKVDEVTLIPIKRKRRKNV